MSKKIGLSAASRLIVASSALLVSFAAQAEELVVGAVSGVTADTVEIAVEQAKKEGLDVRLVVFNDWTTPNIALTAGDVDVNYFQHKAFLDNFIKQTGADLASVGVGLLPNVGLYSTRHKALDALPEGAKVGIASDPVNQNRGLKLLEQVGLIKLEPGHGYSNTLDTITDNPKKLQFVELEGPQLVRVIDDVDLVQGFPALFVNAGLIDLANNALAYSADQDANYAIRFVAPTNKATDPTIARLVEIYQTSADVREKIHQYYAGNDKLYVLSWLKANASQ